MNEVNKVEKVREMRERLGNEAIKPDLIVNRFPKKEDLLEFQQYCHEEWKGDYGDGIKALMIYRNLAKRVDRIEDMIEEMEVKFGMALREIMMSKPSEEKKERKFLDGSTVKKK